MSLTLVQSIAARDTDKHTLNRPALFSKIWGIKKKDLDICFFTKNIQNVF